MFAIPFQLNELEYSVFIILENENLERLKEYDPAELSVRKFIVHIPPHLKLRDIIIGYATPTDLEKIKEMAQADEKPTKILQYLSRGFRFRPEAGDSDAPYLSLRNESRGKEN